MFYFILIKLKSESQALCEVKLFKKKGAYQMEKALKAFQL